MSKTIDNIRAAYQQVQESKFVIPEEIPANERTAFHGAAAAAAKAGKKSFNFGGKTHPVTMKKDTAKAIADQKESVEENLMLNNPYKNKKYSKDDLQRKHGSFKRQLADLQNKKMKAAMGSGAKLNQYDGEIDSMQTKIKQVRHAMKEMQEGYMKDLATADAKTDAEKAKVAADLKKRRKAKDEKSEVEMNPKLDTAKDKGAAMETKESTIREKLWSVLEGADRAKHYKGATKPEDMQNNLKGQGAKDMVNVAKEVDDTEEKGHQDSVKAGKTGPQAKPRSGGDNTRNGDQKIIPSATPIKNIKGTMEAYASMYEKEETNGD